MRNRYVIQVLLATFGFALLLALVAVLQTPDDFSLQRADGSPTELRQGSAGATAPQTTGATHRTVDLRDECDPPAKSIDDCTQPEPQKVCQRTPASHEKASAVAN